MPILVQDFPLIKQGADFLASTYLASENFSPSDCTFTCQIRRFPGGPLLAEPEVSWNGTSLDIFISNMVTSRIPATGSLASSAHEKTWVYDIFANFSDGSRLCLSEGKVYVDPAITTS